MEYNKGDKTLSHLGSCKFMHLPDARVSSTYTVVSRIIFCIHFATDIFLVTVRAILNDSIAIAVKLPEKRNIEFYN